MTLKEKVAEVQPNEIDEIYRGGVWGCPHNHDYLNITTDEDSMHCGCRQIFSGNQIKCTACWNREYKEAQ